MSVYLRKPRCEHCGEPHWFNYWVGTYCASSQTLSVGNLDMVFHLYREVVDKLGLRTVEHLMVVELKTGDETLKGAQRDTLSVFNAAMETIIPVNGKPIHVQSKPGYVHKGRKKIVWHGVHLCRTPRARSDEGPFYWDNRQIDRTMLADVLSFRRDSRWPYRLLDIGRRHKPARQYPLIDERPASANEPH